MNKCSYYQRKETRLVLVQLAFFSCISFLAKWLEQSAIVHGLDGAGPELRVSSRIERMLQISDSIITSSIHRSHVSLSSQTAGHDLCKPCAHGQVLGRHGRRIPQSFVCNQNKEKNRYIYAVQLSPLIDKAIEPEQGGQVVALEATTYYDVYRLEVLNSINYVERKNLSAQLEELLSRSTNRICGVQAIFFPSRAGLQMK